MHSGSAAVLATAFVLDALIGEPWTPLHPVVWMGKAIAPLKRLSIASAGAALVIGALYAGAVTGGFALAAWWAQRVLSAFPGVAFAFETYVLLGCFALKGLVAAGDDLRRALAAGDLAAARTGLGSLCSRDPGELDARELAGAAIESLTENTSDSVVAPLFYYVLFGLPGAVFYRAANTLDAMVGYRGRFEYLGKASARLDDVLNLIPARLTTLGLALAGAFLRLDVRGGFRIWWRDRGATESPNAGHPMAMGAGLLGVTLDKRATYVLGAGLRAPSEADLARTQSMVRLSGWFFAVFAILVLLSADGRYGIRF